MAFIKRDDNGNIVEFAEIQQLDKKGRELPGYEPVDPTNAEQVAEVEAFKNPPPYVPPKTPLEQASEIIAVEWAQRLEDDGDWPIEVLNPIFDELPKISSAIATGLPNRVILLRLSQVQRVYTVGEQTYDIGPVLDKIAAIFQEEGA